jgi:hypothetical protein
MSKPDNQKVGSIRQRGIRPAGTKGGKCELWNLPTTRTHCFFRAVPQPVTKWNSDGRTAATLLLRKEFRQALKPTTEQANEKTRSFRDE